MSGTLINPALIPGTDIVPESIAASGAAYRTTASSIGSSADAVVASWAGLSGVYTAPESPQLLAAMNPVSVDSHAVAATLTSTARLLDELAEAVVKPVRRLKELKQEAEDFVATVRGGVMVSFMDEGHSVGVAAARGATGPTLNIPDEVISWSEHNPSVDRNNELLEQVAAEVAKLSTASAECVNGINALRTDARIAPQEAVTAEQIIAAKDLPWGETGNGDRSCSESVGDGMWTFGEGLLGGVFSLAGVDIHDGWSWTWDTAGAAWGGMVSGLGALAISGPLTLALAAAPDDALPEWAQSFSDWHTSTMTAFGEGIVGTPEQWEEDPVAAGTTAVLNVATFFIPGAGIAAGSTKAATTMARVGLALERGAVRVGDGTLTAAGLTRAGTLAANLSDSLNFLNRTTPDGTNLRELDGVITALTDIPDVVPDNLVPVRAAEVQADASNGSTPGVRPAETSQSVGSAGSSNTGGTTVLESGTGRPGGSENGPTVGGGDRPTGNDATPDATPTTPDQHDSPTHSGDGADVHEPSPDATPTVPNQPDSPTHSGDGAGVHEPHPDATPAPPDAAGGNSPSARGWEPAPVTDLDPHYGEPLSSHGATVEIDPSAVNPRVAEMNDTAAPYGRDVTDGHVLTAGEYAARYFLPNGWDVYPTMPGAVPGTVRVTGDIDTYMKEFGNSVDRIGAEDGDFMAAVVDGRRANFGERSLPIGSLYKELNDYTLSGSMPDGWRIEVSTSAPGFGRPGGATQLRFFDNTGDVVLIGRAIREGVLRR